MISTAADLLDELPKLEKYELLEEIGHGGMATVYRGKDRRLGREVAVKIIHRHLRDNGEVATRFIAEARAAASLKHRGIVEVYDVSSEEDREKYLVAELVRGVTLRKLLVDHRDMPAEIGASIVLEVCDAIQHAHESGIVHRDVKPENVLVELPSHREGTASGRKTPPAPFVVAEESTGGDRDSITDERTSGVPAISAPSNSRREGGVVVKITDFGIAKVLDAQGVTSTGQVLGSPAHMAPEQIEGGDIDVRTDVFALGVLLYEALVGHLPFEGKNPAQVLRRVLEGEYAPVDVERGDVGTRWARIVHAALALAPDDRTATPAVLATQIREELTALGLRDPHQEVVEYFEDGEAYRAKHAPKLVKKLLTRGERAKRKRDVPGAAADFNRALALAPQDAEVQRRVLEMSRGQGRRAVARKAGFVAAGCVVLGLGTFGVVRYMRPSFELKLPDIPRVTATAPDDEEDLGDENADLDADPAPAASRVAGKKKVPLLLGSVRGPLAQIKLEPRKVRFAGAPAGARVTVDGAPYEWSSAIFLKPGPHEVVIASGECCNESTQTARVPPAKVGEEEQVATLTLSVSYRDAKVSLLGAPADGRLVCGALGFTLTPGATSQSVPMNRPTESEMCSFISSTGEAKKTVTVTAGKNSAINWP